MRGGILGRTEPAAGARIQRMPPKKPPRRTAERILEVTLDLFNRFGEPNVSTTLISAELNISPGNLYYHYPAKDELINALFDRYETALTNCCPPPTAWPTSRTPGCSSTCCSS
jgi:AcrR family transcriptional regulator